jgi:hypothetical protein
MDRFDKVVRDRCCHLAEAEKLHSGLKTSKQLKNTLRLYRDRQIAKHFGGDKQVMNEVIIEQIIEPPVMDPNTVLQMPVPKDTAIRPAHLIAQVRGPEDPQGRIFERMKEQREEALASNLERQESIRSQLEEVVAVVEEKMDRGDKPLPADLSRIERLEKQLEKAEEENRELKFEIGRQKQLVRVQAEREMEALEEGGRAEEEAARAKGKQQQTAMRLAIMEADKQVLLNYYEAEKDMINQLTAELPAKDRRYESRLKASSAKVIAKYLLDTLGIDEEAIYIVSGLSMIEEEEGLDQAEEEGGPGPSVIPATGDIPAHSLPSGPPPS